MMFNLLVLLLVRMLAGGALHSRFRYAVWSPFGIVLLVLLFPSFGRDLSWP